jgi:hypothetical protein
MQNMLTYWACKFVQCKFWIHHRFSFEQATESDLFD